MKPRKIVPLIILISLFLLLSANAETLYSYTGRVNVEFSWEHTKDAYFDHYELELRRLDVDGNVIETFVYGTPNLSASIIRPRAGTYEARVRTVNKNTEGVLLYSEW